MCQISRKIYFTYKTLRIKYSIVKTRIKLIQKQIKYISAIITCGFYFEILKICTSITAPFIFLVKIFNPLTQF